jgi:putative adenylate-forming enzyme
MNFKIKILYFLFSLKYEKWLYRNKVASLQLKRWQKLKETLKKSSFYKNILKIDGDLTSYPVINKTIFMANFDTINTYGIKLQEAINIATEAEISRNFNPTLNGITIGLSTGTSDNRGVFLADEDDRTKWVACILDRVIGLSLSKRKVAFFLRANSNLYESTKSKLLSFNFFDIFIDPANHIDKLNLLQPHILVAQPTILMFLAKNVLSGNLKIKPKKIISIAEVLSSEDQTFLTNAFNQQIHQVYQCTEGFLASTCDYGTMHFNEDFLVIEKKYIDEEQTRFHPIITDLLRTAQPVIRYELNDIITEKKDCKCGSKYLGIQSIEGRSDDILVLNDCKNIAVQIFPDFIRRAIVLSDELITDYAVIQVGQNVLQLYIESTNMGSFQLAQSSITSLLLNFNIENIIFEKVELNPYVIGSKKRRVRNEWK